MNTAGQPISYIQYRSGEYSPAKSEVIVEAPVTLTVNGEIWLSFMCTPVDVEALAVGFLYNEGVIHSAAEVCSVRLCASGENVDVWLNHAAHKPARWRRTSGCTGGLTSVETPPQALPLNGVLLRPEDIWTLLDHFNEAQSLYRETGGVHTSALSDGERLVAIAEDIGRHNTLDKIAGRCLLYGISTRKLILLTTGRVSSEMLQKATRLGTAVIISRTSPSSLSVELARQLGLTLIGYARRGRFNIYTHPERILIAQADQRLDEQPLRSNNG